MTRAIDRSNCFILEAFDRTFWCAIAQAPLQVADIEVLRAVLGLAADEDPKLEQIYPLDDEEITAIVSLFGTFDPRQISDADLVATISRWSGLYEIPYLVHTNYELPLLLDGRKKLAHMYGTYPPAAFYGEDRFDHWVAEGALHREEVLEPFEMPIGDFQGGAPSTTPPGVRSGAFPLMSSSGRHRKSPAAGTSTLNGSMACCWVMRTGRTTGGSRPAWSGAPLAARPTAAWSRRLDSRGASHPAFARCHQLRRPCQSERIQDLPMRICKSSCGEAQMVWPS